MIKSIFFLILISFSYSYSMMDRDFEKKAYEEVSQEEDKIGIEENNPENQSDLVKKFVKNDNKDFIFLAKVLNRKKIPTVIRNIILNFLYISYPHKIKNYFGNRPNKLENSSIDVVHSLCEFDNKTLIAGTKNGYILILDLKTNNVTRKFIAHSKESVSQLLKINDQIYISASSLIFENFYPENYIIIKIWNINSDTCLHTIEATHPDGLPVHFLELEKLSETQFALNVKFEYVSRSYFMDKISYSIDGNRINKEVAPDIRISAEQFRVVANLEGTDFNLHETIKMKDKLVLHLFKNEISQLKILNLLSNQYEASFERYYIESLVKINDFIFATQSHKGPVRIWDIRIKKCISELPLNRPTNFRTANHAFPKNDYFSYISSNYYFSSISSKEKHRLIKVRNNAIGLSTSIDYSKCYPLKENKVVVYGEGFDIRSVVKDLEENCCSCCTIL